MTPFALVGFVINRFYGFASIMWKSKLRRKSAHRKRQAAAIENDRISMPLPQLVLQPSCPLALAEADVASDKAR
jgi:hypothetical protein